MNPGPRRLLLATLLSAAPSASTWATQDSEPAEPRKAPAFQLEDARDHVRDLTLTLLDEHLLLAGVPRPRWDQRCNQALRELLTEEPEWRREARLPETLPKQAWAPLVRRLLHPSRNLTVDQVKRRRDLLAHAVLKALADPHTHLQDLDQSAGMSLLFNLTTGLLVAEDQDGLYLDLVMVGSDGHRKALRAGDRLLAINEAPASDLSLRRAQKLIEEPCRIRVQRAGWPRPVALDIRKMNLAMLHPSATLLPDGVGYLRYPVFDGSAMRLQQEMRRLQRRGATAWILDLRGNPGGLLVDAQTLADLFLDEGLPITWITERHQVAADTEAPVLRPEEIPAEDLTKAGSETQEEATLGSATQEASDEPVDVLDVGGILDQDPPTQKAHRNQTISDDGLFTSYWMISSSRPAIPKEWPLVVLVDRSSASASELVAQALQAHRRALVVGRPSYGKGIGQTASVVFHHRTRRQPAATKPATDPEEAGSEHEHHQKLEIDHVYQPLWISSFRFESPRQPQADQAGVLPDLRVKTAEESPTLIENLALLWEDTDFITALRTLELTPQAIEQMRAENTERATSTQTSPDKQAPEAQDTRELPDLPTAVLSLLDAHDLGPVTPALREALWRVLHGNRSRSSEVPPDTHSDQDLLKALRVLDVLRGQRK